LSAENKDAADEMKRIHVDRKRAVRTALLVVCDAIFIAFAYILALLMRFEFDFVQIGETYLHAYQILIIPYILIAIASMWAFRLYHSIWTYASTTELTHLVLSWLVTQAGILVVYFITQIRMPLSFWIMGAILGFCFTAALRFGYRFLRMTRVRMRADSVNGKTPENVMIIGAGSAGRDLIHEIKFSDKLNWKVVCAIDDNPSKAGKYLDGVPIVGGRKRIIDAVKEYGVTQIVFDIPSATGTVRRDILEICQQTDCKLLAMPGIYQLLDGQVNVSRLREVQICLDAIL